MRLFFKHLLQSVRRKPLQPLVLILTLAISVGVCIMAFGLNDCFAEENELSRDAEYGCADITLELNGTSKSRFMFADRVEDFLFGKANAASAFEIVIFLTKTSESEFGVAVDFDDINSIFDFSFTAYNEVSRANVSETAFISEAFAKSNGLAVGDSFDTQLFGYKKSYTVSAISPTKYLASYDVMVDISGVIDVMARDSLFVSALGDSFKPGSTVYIDVKDDEYIREYKELLLNDDEFSDKSITVVSDDTRMDSDKEIMRLIISVAISFACILSVTVTFCCFYILSCERSEENAAFLAAGARARHLNFLQYAEIFFYWLVGGAVGVFLSVALMKITVWHAGFEYSDGSVGIKNAALGLGLILITSLITAAVFILSGTHGAKPARKNRTSLFIGMSLAAAVLTTALTFTLRVKDAFVPGLFSMLSIFFLLFVSAPSLLRLFMRWLDRFLAKRNGKNQALRFPSLVYAVKNLLTVKVLHNFSRLITLLVAVLLSSFFVIVSSDGYVLAAKKIVSSDYAVLNGAESCYGKLLASSAAESVSRSYFGSGSLHDGNYTPMISSENIEVFSDIVEISALPRGNGIIISKGQADARELGVGDTDILHFNGDSYEVVVSEIINLGMNIIIFDCENFGVSHNMILVDGKEGTTDAELLREITKETAVELAAVVTPDSLMRHRLGSINIYLNTGDVLLTVAVIFAAVGMIDNLSQSYRERRSEFELYRAAGMSARSVRRMKTFEVLISLLFGLFLGIVAFLFSTFSIERGMLAYGYSVFDAIAMLSK
ncbi:MAG: ABC transporter permease [Ruminococcaceae bacterium]|nr:ABC transporter permease [Oscillospiraceae bacterium]